MKKIKRKFKFKNLIFLLIIILIIGVAVFSFFKISKKLVIKTNNGYVTSNINEVVVYDEEFKASGKLIRGLNISFKDKIIKDEKEIEYYKINSKEGMYIKKEDIVLKKTDILKEKKVYVRTGMNLLSSDVNGKLLMLANKGEELEVIGYSNILSTGFVDYYKVKLGKIEGFIKSDYVVLDKETSLLNYEPEKYYNVHNARGDRYGGGNAGNLDYYPVIKPKFPNNVMPDNVYSLYINAAAIRNVDPYIEYAKTTKINAFVVDIKDTGTSAYDSTVMRKYSPTNADNGLNKFEDYKASIKKIKDAGFYVIGRISTFNDPYYTTDHPENTIGDTRTNKPLYMGRTYWPSAYNRDVWEFNVELAKEAVKEIGFNEIQFDYVRFPDRTGALEAAGVIDFKNIYKEDKAQAIQRFLIYAKDEIHKLNAYVSADVFGECAHTYVAAYGQYWPAISNVVDVISAMPYPDHFNAHDYGISEVVWTVPYKLLLTWGRDYAAIRQTEIPTPATARTWIQTYDTIKPPYIEYDASKVSDQIKALYEAGLNGGYMTWNSNSNLNKYKSQKSAYNKEYR
ncbi:MAG: putative glycoside hydrolase [Bacilli bacterium]